MYKNMKQENKEIKLEIIEKKKENLLLFEGE